MRPAQFQAKVDLLEREFHTDLVRALQVASAGSHSQFFRSEEHNPHGELRGRTDALTNELLARAQQIIEIRTKLKQWPDKSLAAKFIVYCERFNDLGDPHRLGVRKHADTLLQEIKAISFD